MRCETVVITENHKIAEGVHSLRVPFDGEIKPGQFFMLKPELTSVLLPRAISVCNYRDGLLTFLVQNAGRGTDVLCTMEPGDPLTLTGPLGNGFPAEELSGKIALVGGGIGVAPLLYTASVLAEHGRELTACLGFRDEPFLTAQYEACCNEVLVATESGRVGHKGYVTGLFDPKDFDTVLCCGPEPMMKAVANLCAAAGTPVYVSMENKMACGVGGCLVCTCTDKEGHNRRTCLDGPVFRGEEVDFDA